MASYVRWPYVRGYKALVSFCIALSISLAGSITAQETTRPLRTLVTTREAHSLTIAEAQREYPVALKAVVTYYDRFEDPRRPALLVHDATGSIFVGLTSFPAFPVEPGMLVEVRGVSAAGDFAPIVGKADLRIIGRSRLPPNAPPVSMSQLLTGIYDGQWVEIEGMIHSIQPLGKGINLKIAMNDGMIGAAAPLEAGMDYLRLIGAKVKIHANTIPVYNRKQQMIGVRLLFPGSRAMKVLNLDDADPFALPVTPISGLLHYTPDLAFNHRVHVRGTVTLDWPGRSICIQSGGDGLCAQITDELSLLPGEIVDVVGFPEGGGMTSILTDAVFRRAGPGTPFVPATISAEQALQGDYDADLVSVEGKLIGEDHGAKERTLLLSSGKLVFPVVLSGTSPDAVSRTWQAGSILRVTGICSVKVDTVEAQPNFSTPTLFRILLRSPKDVTVVHGVSWWTPNHLLRFLAVVLAATLFVLGWVMMLRHRITIQAALIQSQNATLRELSFHDGLTGLANRRKFDETLQREFRNAAEAPAPISLLMIDIDHFKSLNDAYGHQCGDECLVKVAKALATATLRTSDLLARYGGEEFAVIMPVCDEEGAVATGERMRAAVWDLSIAHTGSPFNRRLSISVGTATMIPDQKSAPASLIARADSALYRSKLDGRNRTTCSAEVGNVLSLAAFAG